MSNNLEGVNIRKKKMENFLNYINKHNYLSKNPVFLIFISDDFERYKNEIREGVTFFDICQKKVKELIIGEKKQTHHILDLSEENIKKEKLRFQRIEKGVEMSADFIKNILSEIKTKSKTLLKISEVTHILNNSNFQLEVNGVDNDFVVMKSEYKIESDCYKSIGEKLNGYAGKIELLYENVVNYRNVVIALIEIFERKKQIDFELQKEKNEEFLQNKEGINKMGKLANELNIQFIEELNNFKENLEGNYLIYIEQLFTLKKQMEEETKYSFSGERFGVVNNTNNNPLNYNDDHFS